MDQQFYVDAYCWYVHNLTPNVIALNVKNSLTSDTLLHNNYYCIIIYIIAVPVS